MMVSPFVVAFLFPAVDAARTGGRVCQFDDAIRIYQTAREEPRALFF